MNSIAEIKLSYSSLIKKEDRKIIKSGVDAYRAFIEVWDQDIIEVQEECKALLLNRANEILGVIHLSKGGSAGTVVDIKLLMAIAVKACAHGIILAHNHPSGNLKASSCDIALTNKLETACNYLDIELMDHIIITKESYSSIKNS